MPLDEPENEAASEEVGTSEITEESTNTEVSESSEETSQEATSSEVTPQEEWLIPGRFRKGEEAKLAESYRNMESEYSRRGQELHTLRQQVNQPKVDPEERTRRFAEDVKVDPVHAIEKIIDSKTRGIAEQVEQAKFEAAFQQKMSNKHFAELEPVMTNIAQQLSPMLTPEQKRDPQILDWLYYIAKGVKADENANKAERSGVRKGEKAALKKSKAMVEGSSGSQGHTKRSFDTLTREEMRAELAKGRLQD